MSRLERRFIVFSFIITAATSVACGHSSSVSPLAPSFDTNTLSAPSTPGTQLPAAPAISTGVSIVGSVNASPAAGSPGFRALTTGMTVGVVGTSIATEVAASGHFELDDVPEGDIDLQFSGPGIDARAPVGAVVPGEHIELTVTVTGSNATIEHTLRTTPDSKIGLAGRIVFIDTAGSSFRIGDTTVLVTPATSIHRGSQSAGFADLHVGDEVHVYGSRDGSVVRAEQIKMPAAEVTVSGTVAAVSGTCPSITFTLDGVSVAASTSTTYGGGNSCGDVKNGDERSATGIKQGDGRLLARYVTGADRVPPPVPDVTISGTVANVGGTCPSLTFTLDGKVVATNASTTFSGDSCANVRNGDHRSATGTKQSDGHLLARSVSSAVPTEVKLSGTVASLAGTCPSLTFAVNGTVVVAVTTSSTPAATNAATTFSPGACSDVKNGATLTLVGTAASDGRVVARTVTIAKPEPEVTLTGIIAALAGACPSLTFTIGGVPAETNAATGYSGGGQCADVKNGEKRTLVGTLQSSGRKLARHVSSAVPTEVKLSGTVASLAGTCPSLTFTMNGTATVATMVSSTLAATNSATTFSPGGCSDVKNGAAVTLVGTAGSDGRVMARTVSIAKSEPEVTVTGVIAALAGTCPSLTFTIGGYQAETNATTSYGGGGQCADVKNGEKRTLVGTLQSSGRKLARYVSGAMPTEVTLSGTVASLAGTCPSLTFAVNGTTTVATMVSSTLAATNSATTFSPGACSDVKNGATLTLVGTAGSDGRVMARTVSVAKSDAEVTVTGTIASLAGICPSVTFTLDGTAAATNASTTYGGGGVCTGLKNGDRWTAVGTKQSDGRLLLGCLTPLPK